MTSVLSERVEVFAMLVTQLSKDQASSSEDSIRVPPGVVTILNVVPIDVAERLCETGAECPPPFPFTGLFSETEVAVIGEDPPIEGLAHQRLPIRTSRSAAPTSQPVLDKDRRLTRNRLPVPREYEPLDVRPKIGVHGVGVDALQILEGILKFRNRDPQNASRKFEIELEKHLVIAGAGIGIRRPPADFPEMIEEMVILT